MVERRSSTTSRFPDWMSCTTQVALDAVEAADQGVVFRGLPVLVAVVGLLGIRCIHDRASFQSLARPSRRALPTTHTELRDMAAPANMGESRGPPKQYSSPAAMGMPTVL